MLSRKALVLLALAAIAVAPAGEVEAPAAPQAALDELDLVEIIGERSPALWKLSRKGHELWILGTHRPQPRNMRWDARRIEAAIAESREVIYPGMPVVASSGISLLPEVVAAQTNPASARLQDLMPAEAHAKWLVLRQKYLFSSGSQQAGPKFVWSKDAKWLLQTQRYLGGDGIELVRPTLAWETLRLAAMERHGLVNYDFESVLTRIAAKHSVPVRKLPVAREHILVLNPDEMLAREARKHGFEALKSTDYGDMGCLVANLDLLEPAMQALETRAQAWARGDVAAFQSADSSATVRDCVTELVGAVSGAQRPGTKGGKSAQQRYSRAREDSEQEMEDRWLRELQTAVKKNEMTFTVFPIERLLAADGPVAVLRKQGFVLDEEQ
jgi:hypothetical protein